MLLDTSGLLCVHHRQEPFHEEACQYFLEAKTLFTHGFVLAEFVALAQARRLPRQPALQFMQDLVANPDITIIWPDEILHNRAMVLLSERLDKTYSLCDAVSFVLMRDMKVNDALTTDHHFEQEGFRKLLG
jgi:uncharacterized protein